MIKNWDDNHIKRARVNNKGVLILDPDLDDPDTHFRPDTLNLPEGMRNLLRGRVESSGYGVGDSNSPGKKKDVWEEPAWAKPEIVGLERQFTHDEMERYHNVARDNIVTAKEKIAIVKGRFTRPNLGWVGKKRPSGRRKSGCSDFSIAGKTVSNAPGSRGNTHKDFTGDESKVSG